MDKHELENRLAMLEAENAKLRAAATGKIAVKVSDKGAVSVYGLQRFPVTLYAAQWETLAGRMGEVMTFIETNKARLSYK